MGTRGRIPNRSDLRRRRNKVEITHAPGGDDIEIPEPDEDWHPIATQWYESLKKSGQRVFYENSDWCQAFYIAEAMSRSMRTSNISASLIGAVLTGAAELLTTEGARRRARVELERAELEGETTVSEAMAVYKTMAQVAS